MTEKYFFEKNYTKINFKISKLILSIPHLFQFFPHKIQLQWDGKNKKKYSIKNAFAEWVKLSTLSCVGKIYDVSSITNDPKKIEIRQRWKWALKIDFNGNRLLWSITVTNE